VIDQTFLGGFKGKVTREGSHKVVHGGEVVLFLDAEDRQLVVDLALKRIDCFGSVVKTPTLLIDLGISFALRVGVD
jgi:hypothetical protein